MEQFNLDKWLKDKSRKICTRDGRPVRIVCWDLKCNTPIIAAIQWNQEREDCYCYDTAGRCANNVGEIDLFFADEEKELTEFEKRFIELIRLWRSGNTNPEENLIQSRFDAKELLDLARKEIQPEIDEKLKEEYNRGYSIGKFDAGEAKVKELVAEFEKGRQNALKDLPKWKKATKCKEFDKHVCVMDYYTLPFLDTEVNEGDYYIKLEDLKTLPKEE